MYITSIVLSALLQASSAQPANSNDNPDKEMVCRRIEVTGSLARKERVCKTRAEWRRLAEAGNSVAREVVDWSRTRPAGGP